MRLGWDRGADLAADLGADTVRGNTGRDSVRDIGHGTGLDPDDESAAPASASAAGLVRWGAFSCALVPLTLLTCGVPATTAIGAAAGLAAVTAVCGLLLHRSADHAYAPHASGRLAAARPGPHRGRHSRTGSGLHRGGRYWAPPDRP